MLIGIHLRPVRISNRQHVLKSIPPQPYLRLCMRKWQCSWIIQTCLCIHQGAECLDFFFCARHNGNVRGLYYSICKSTGALNVEIIFFARHHGPACARASAVRALPEITGG